METKRNTPSVIAKLMGLDEMPPQRPAHRQLRVLSESYLQKSASVVSQEKRSNSKKDRHKSRIGSKRKANSMVNDINKDAPLRYLEQRSYPFERTLDMKSAIVFDCKNNGENGKSGKSIERRNNLRSLQKHRDGNARDSFEDNVSLKDGASRMPTKIVVLKPNIGNVRDASKPSFLFDSQTTFAWEAKKQLLERLKMTRFSKEGRPSSRSCTLREMFSMTDPGMKTRAELASVSSNEGWKNESVIKLPLFNRFSFSSNPTAKLKKMAERDDETSSGKCENNLSTNSEDNPLASNSLSSDASVGKEDVLFSCGDAQIEQQSEPMACNFSGEEAHFSPFSESSFGQDSPIRSHKDGFISSNCIESDEEFPKNTSEAYQPSPNSVLDKEDNSSSSEYCESVSTDLHGLWMQLQLLKSESEENHSGPEMVVSSDEDATEKASIYTGQNLKAMRCFGAKESRDFSYLVDVLEASGFHDGNVEISFQRWHSPECMASHSVFETLEKKYGEQDSWNKAERRLLFDRINSGVMEILRPCIDIAICPKPLRRKMSTIFRRDTVEEELWKFLLSQENEVNRELSDKAVGSEPWLEFVDEVDSIAREIEVFLVDELAAELVSI